MGERMRNLSERLLGQLPPVPRTQPLSDVEREAVYERDLALRARLAERDNAAAFGRNAVLSVVTSTEQLVMAGRLSPEFEPSAHRDY
jgi:hypothetical protein